VSATPSGTLAERFAGQMGRLLGPDFPEQIALAVSGGGDSMAMLALAHDWARVWGLGLWVVTIDHGLREASAREAGMVAAECRLLGHPHATLRWHWDGSGNLQDAARRARLDLIDRWRGGIDHVLFAHTQDDVAETFVMRLARGSGVEGLSAMAARRVVVPGPGRMRALDPADVTATATPPERQGERQGEGQGERQGQGPGPGQEQGPGQGPGFVVIRPLLHETRADLRHYVETLKVPHVDDPSNSDPRFDRARVRAALGDLGIGAAHLAATAHRMARASEALGARAAEVAARVARTDGFGTITIDREGFAPVERDTQLRLLAAALCWVASAPYRPRAAALEHLLDRVLAGGGGTLHGADLRVGKTGIEVFRELNAVRDTETPAGPALPWDRRWVLCGHEINGLTVRALGPEGWGQLPGTRDAPPPHSPPAFVIAQSLPAVFDGDRLVAFQPCGFGPPHDVALRPPFGRFDAFLLSR